jgi:orotate phosphoribosyltransferase
MADLYKKLEELGAIKRGHFKLSSGRHSDIYFEKFRLLERPDTLSEVCSELCSQVKHKQADKVLGPTTGGVLVAYEMAKQLGISALYVERQDDKRVLRRGAQLNEGEKVIVADDVLTTGESIQEVINLAKSYNADVVAVCVLVDRSEVAIDFKTSFFSAIKVEAKSYPPEELPDWLSEIELTEPGSRRIG